MAYSGSCHCGAVAFTVASDPPKQAMSCNCSHCRRKGFLLSFVPAEQFSLDSGEDQLATYTFNKHQIRHRFCRRCGLRPFSHKADQSFYAVNVACLDDVEPDELVAAPVAVVDGLHDDFRNPPKEIRHL